GELRAQGQPHQTILLLDHSKSMKGNDPFFLNHFAAHLLVDLAAPRDEIGIFDLQSSVVPMDPVAGRKEALHAAIDQLSYGGKTPCATPLSRALTELKEKQRPEALASIVFLTDGVCDEDDPIEKALPALQAARIPVFTIALGKETEHRRQLQRLAEQTGGIPFAVTDAADLPEVFAKLAGRLHGAEYQSGMLARGEQIFAAAPYLERIVLLAAGKVETARFFGLHSPTGPVALDGKNARIRSFANHRHPNAPEVYTIVEIPEPPPGEWRYEVEGKEEKFSVAVIQIFDLVLSLEGHPQRVEGKETVELVARLATSRGRVPDPAFLRQVSVTLHHRPPGGDFQRWGPLPFDGKGAFRTRLPLPEPGEHVFYAVARYQQHLNRRSPLRSIERLEPPPEGCRLRFLEAEACHRKGDVPFPVSVRLECAPPQTLSAAYQESCTGRLFAQSPGGEGFGEVASFSSEPGGRYTALVTLPEEGHHRLQARLECPNTRFVSGTSDLFVGELPPLLPLDFGTPEGGSVATRGIDLSPWRPFLPLDITFRPEALTGPSAASIAVDADGAGGLLATLKIAGCRSEGEGNGAIAIVPKACLSPVALPVSYTVHPTPFLACYRRIYLGTLALLGGAFLLYGFLSPPAFSPRRTICWSASRQGCVERDPTAATEVLFGALHGHGKGRRRWYTPARLYFGGPDDFLGPKGETPVAWLEATRSGILLVTLQPGQTFLCTEGGGEEPITMQATPLHYGTVYRVDIGGEHRYFEIH
ncbi:MAG: VWA domain-containing protein, partial [Deltaproteobacteria bacterium]